MEKSDPLVEMMNGQGRVSPATAGKPQTFLPFCPPAKGFVERGVWHGCWAWHMWPASSQKMRHRTRARKQMRKLGKGDGGRQGWMDAGHGTVADTLQGDGAQDKRKKRDDGTGQCPGWQDELFPRTRGSGSPGRPWHAIPFRGLSLKQWDEGCYPPVIPLVKLSASH